MLGWVMKSIEPLGHELLSAFATIRKGLRLVGKGKFPVRFPHKLLFHLIEECSSEPTDDHAQREMYHTAVIQLLPVVTECASASCPPYALLPVAANESYPSTAVCA